MKERIIVGLLVLAGIGLLANRFIPDSGTESKQVGKSQLVEQKGEIVRAGPKIDPAKAKEYLLNFKKQERVSFTVPPKDRIECMHSSNTFRCVDYVSNYDGDTIRVNIHSFPLLVGEKASVRVRGIDTPEKHGKLPCEKEKARVAQKLVENLLKNAKHIEMRDVGKDKYFRYLAQINFDGKDLGDILIKNKLAYPYSGGTKLRINWCDN